MGKADALTTYDPARVRAAQDAIPVCTWMAAYLPRVLPYGWKLVELCEDGAKYLKFSTHGKHKKQTRLMAAIISGNVELDDKRWIHMSVSTLTRVPTWHELVEVKEWMLGPEAKAIQVIPPRSEYINIHPYTLHLFSCLDGEVFPDFTAGSGSI